MYSKNMQRITLKDVDISLEGSGSRLDGRITGADGLSVTISSNDSVEYEAGSYLPVEVVDGRVSISGSVVKAWVSNDFFKVLFPKTEVGERMTSVIKPSFTLRGKVVNSKSPSRKMEIYGVKFNSVGTGSMSIDSVAKQSLPFNATGYKFY